MYLLKKGTDAYTPGDPRWPHPALRSEFRAEQSWTVSARGHRHAQQRMTSRHGRTARRKEGAAGMGRPLALTHSAGGAGVGGPMAG
jgi:hypothetical protein